MKIKMHSMAASPNGQWLPDHEYEVTEEFGRSLVEGGYATCLDAPEPEPEAEYADLVVVKETAAKKARKRSTN